MLKRTKISQHDAVPNWVPRTGAAYAVAVPALPI